MRLVATDLSDFLADGVAGFVWAGERLSLLTPYFSRREASMLRRLLVFPFPVEGNAEALLVAVETPYLDSAEDHLRIILAAVSDRSVAAIRAYRGRYADKISHAVVFKTDEIETVANRISGRSSGSVNVLVVELADIVSQISTLNVHIDPYRVWQDVLQTVAALFGSTGTVCDAGQQRALVFMHEEADADLGLLTRQISSTLTFLLPELAEPPELRFRHGTHPAADHTLASLARSLI